MLPNAIEPMISQAVIDKTVVPEMFLRMSCAVAYFNSGQKERAISHIDKAVALALPDRMYGFLSEYIRHFGGLLEQRIAPLMIYTTLRALMICQACGLDKPKENFW